MSEIMELEKTLLIDEQEYNINAKSAEKVENKLKKMSMKLKSSFSK